MSPDVSDILFPLVRWVHIVCTTLIVGGTLFYELVVPIASEDLKREQQLYVFARARLVFRWVVWIGVIGILLSGAASLYRMWHVFQRDELIYIFRWAIVHMSLGIAALIIAVLLTIGRQPPEKPVLWMRINLVVLLVVIFLGDSTRYFQFALREKEGRVEHVVQGKVPPAGQIDSAATHPATRP